VWDVRSTKSPLESLSLGASVWDIKANKAGRIAVASIYDGFRFSSGTLNSEIGSKLLPEFESFTEFTKHTSICYASEWTDLK
jgi:hypothetical protein